MSEEKEIFGQKTTNFIGGVALIVIYQIFPESLFWVLLISFIGMYCLLIYSYKENLRYKSIIILSSIIISFNVISYTYPEIINFLNLPEYFASEMEMNITLVILSNLVYFIVSLIFHTLIKSHWINLVSATFLIMIYRVTVQIEQVMTISYTFKWFLILVIGFIGFLQVLIRLVIVLLDLMDFLRFG